MPSKKSSSHQEAHCKTNNEPAPRKGVSEVQTASDSIEKLKALLESNESFPANLKETLIKHLDKAEQESEQYNSEQAKEYNSVFASLVSQVKQTPVQVIDKVSTRVNRTVETIRNDKLEQVKSEVRRWVDQVDLQSEAIKLLSQLSIELKTSVRLVPDPEGKLGLKPEVNTKAQLKWGEDLDKKDQPSSEKTS